MALLKTLKADRPQRILEIGTDGGGTLCLSAHVASPTARILSLDIAYDRAKLKAYPQMAKPGQRITCLGLDSHAPETLEEVRDRLRGQMLDFLFIDGDHSYQGAVSDLNMYGPLVRPGGLVAMHDINLDYRTRFGRETPNDVGEVPRVWSELGLRFPNKAEWIEDAGQDGYGIGYFRWPSH